MIFDIIIIIIIIIIRNIIIINNIVINKTSPPLEDKGTQTQHRGSFNYAINSNNLLIITPQHFP